ncbi:MAG: IMP cyclohydrolase [bacterium]
MALQDYKTIVDDHFPQYMSLSFSDEEPKLVGEDIKHLIYEKMTWSIHDADADDTIERGLRYGENPGQEAALYRPVNGHLLFGGVEIVRSGDLVGSMDNESLIQVGKHPGKTNLTDIDHGLAIIKYFHETPAAVILKHNNPCGAALADDLHTAFTRAWEGDPIAPFGGTLVVNRAVDRDTAQAIAAQYFEVICAPEYEDGVVEILSSRKNLRIVRIKNIDRLPKLVGRRFLELKSLSDGCVIPQWSYVPIIGKDKVVIHSWKDIAEHGVIPKDVPERAMEGGRLARTGRTASIQRAPTEAELKDMWFGWIVEAGVSSNSVLITKNLATVSVGAGGQDRVSMAKLAVSKAYESERALLAQKRFGILYDALALEVKRGNRPKSVLEEIDEQVRAERAGLVGATAVSEAFFPYRDGADALLEAGVKSIIQPGDSLRGDFEVVEACNEHGATMIFTGQRCFRH